MSLNLASIASIIADVQIVAAVAEECRAEEVKYHALQGCAEASEWRR